MQAMSFFKGLDPKTIADLDRSARRINFAAREDLFCRGEKPHHIFALIGGRVKIWRETAAGASQTLIILEPQTIVGSLAVAQGTSHPVTATALDHVETFAWTATQFRIWLTNDAALAARMLRLVAQRAEQMLDRLEELTSVPLEQRLARVLLRLSADCGEECGHDSLRLRITRQDLADLTSVTLPTVSRIMSRWRQTGFIGGGRGEVQIIDLKRLSSIADLAPPRH